MAAVEPSPQYQQMMDCSSLGVPVSGRSGSGASLNEGGVFRMNKGEKERREQLDLLVEGRLRRRVV